MLDVYANVFKNITCIVLFRNRQKRILDDYNEFRHLDSFRETLTHVTISGLVNVVLFSASFLLHPHLTALQKSCTFPS